MIVVLAVLALVAPGVLPPGLAAAAGEDAPAPIEPLAPATSFTEPAGARDLVPVEPAPVPAAAHRPDAFGSDEPPRAPGARVDARTAHVLALDGGSSASTMDVPRVLAPLADVRAIPVAHVARAPVGERVSVDALAAPAVRGLVDAVAARVAGASASACGSPDGDAPCAPGLAAEPCVPGTPDALPCPVDAPAPPPLTFLVDSRVTGAFPQRTVGAVGEAVPVDADGDATTGVAGVDVVVLITPTTDGAGVRLTIEAPPGLEAAAALPDLEILVRVDLSGTPVVGSSATERDFVDVGYAVDGPQPHRFAAEAVIGGLDDAESTITVDLDLVTVEPALTILASTYRAAGFDAPRASTMDASALLAGIEHEFLASLTLRQLATDEPATIVDWRAAYDVDVLVRVATRDASGALTTTFGVTGMPERAGLTMRGEDPLAIAFDADGIVPRVDVGMDVAPAAGPVTMTRVVLEDVPAHALVTLGATGLTYRGSTPLGVVDFTTTDHGSVLRLAGDHVAIANGSSGMSVSARVTGLESVAFSAADEVLVHAQLASPRPFTVRFVQPDLDAFVTINDLPDDVHVRLALPDAVSYRASAPIARVEAAVASGPLSLEVVLEGVPRRVDVAMDADAGRASVTLDAPLGALDVLASHEDGFAGTAFRHAALTVRDFPGLAVAWAPDGSMVDAQATPAGAAVGLVLVQLSATAEFPARPEPVFAVIDLTPGAEKVAARVEDFRSARFTRNDTLVAALDLSVPHRAGVSVITPELDATVLVHDLPAEVRVDTDLVTRFAYAASHAIALIDVTTVDHATAQSLHVVVEDLPRSVLVLLDTANGTATADVGASVIGRVLVDARAPGGFGDSGFRHLVVDVSSIPGLSASWSDEGAAFATDGRALGVARVAFSTRATASDWPSYPGDYVVIKDHTAAGGAQEVFAQVTGLKAARVNATDARVAGALDLDAARPLDVRVETGDPACLERETTVVVRNLPSLAFDSDLASFVDYRADAPIGSIAFDTAENGRTDKGGICYRKSVVGVDVADLPAGLRLDWTQEPLTAVYAATGPIGAIDLDVYSLAGEVDRILVGVRDLPAALAVHLSPGSDHAVFEASAPIGVVEATVSTLADPAPPADPDQPHRFAYYRDVDANGDAKDWLVYAKVTGLQAARFAGTRGGVATTLTVAPGAFDVHVRDDAGEVPVEVAVGVEDLPATTALSTDGATLLHADFSAPVRRLDLAACMGARLAACHGDALFLLARAIDVPARLHVDATPSEARFDASGTLGSFDLEMRDARGLDGSGDAGAIRQVRAGVTGLNPGVLRFGDAHHVEIAFERPVGVSLLVTPVIDYRPPYYGPAPAAFVNVFTPESVNAASAEIRLGSKPEEGVRAFRSFLDTNPARIEVEANLPDVGVLAWSHWDRVPQTYLRLEKPPSFLGLEMWETNPEYPLAGITDEPGFYWDGASTSALNLKPGPSTTPTAVDARLNITASEDSGALRLWFVLGGNNNRSVEEGHPDYLHVDLDRIPKGTTRVQIVTDARVRDTYAGYDGTYLAVDVQFAQPVVVFASAVFGSTGVRIIPSTVVDEYQRQDGTTSRVFFDMWEGFSPDYHALAHMWADLRVIGTMQVDQFDGVDRVFMADHAPRFEWMPTKASTIDARFVDADVRLRLLTGYEEGDSLAVCWRHLAGATKGHLDELGGVVLWKLTPPAEDPGCMDPLFGV